MVDRPILFSAPMVRALLDGRKTQTRRVLKPQPEPFVVTSTGAECEVAAEHIQGDRLPRIRLGNVITRQEIRFAVGDRLWVRETFRVREGGIIRDGAGGQMDYVEPEVVYGADVGLQAGKRRGQLGEIWKPAIHLPRWASRLTLTVTSVRVQRLQEISEEDAKAEAPDDRHSNPVYRERFWDLWGRLHGPGAWDANPWVVALTFTVARRNIDAPAAVGGDDGAE